MEISQYNNNATRGRYEIDSFQLGTIFSEANPCLISYILERSYINKKDSRVVHDSDGTERYHRIVLNAVSTLHNDDKFNAADGEMLTKLKLYGKAAGFIADFQKKLGSECRMLKHRLTYYPSARMSDSLIDPAKPRCSTKQLSYSITDSHSFAKFTIPFTSDGSILSLDVLCGRVAGYTSEILLHCKNVNVDVYLNIENFTNEFTEDIFNAFVAKAKRLGGGNWHVEKGPDGKPRALVITVHTRKSPEDRHDPKKAAKELVISINRSIRKLDRLICKTATNLVDRYTRTGRLSKAIKRAMETLSYCEGKGLVKKPEEFVKTLQSLQV